MLWHRSIGLSDRVLPRVVCLVIYNTWDYPNTRLAPLCMYDHNSTATIF